MSTFRYRSLSIALPILAAVLLAESAYANQLVYVPLSKPCRLLDTRISTGGAGPLSDAHGAYVFGAFDADIQGDAQHGSATGCSIPKGIEAVSVNMNLLNASDPGNITTWSADAGTIAPTIGTAVYNPTVASATAGQVQYNSGYTNVPVGISSGSNPGRFFLQVANGQIDMTINLVGYWLPVSWNEDRSGNHAVAFGEGTAASGYAATAMGSGAVASGVYSTATGQNTVASGSTSVAMGAYSVANNTGSTAIGVNTAASGEYATAIGSSTQASGIHSTAMGQNTTASGSTSVAMGAFTVASGEGSTALGLNTTASGHYSTAMGTSVSTNGHRGSFIYGDASPRTGIVNSADNQFMAIASGGFVFVTSSSGATGAELTPGSSSWTVLSDRNAKTAVQAVDGREVLKKIASLPLNTWQYKTQDAKFRHMGPMAQDFYAAFQLGESDKGIDTVDADGVALAAIQGLNTLLVESEAKAAARLDERDREIAKLRSDKDHEIELLRSESAAQRTRVAALELLTGNLVGDLADMRAQLAMTQKAASATVAVALQKP